MDSCVCRLKSTVQRFELRVLNFVLFASYGSQTQREPSVYIYVYIFGLGRPLGYLKFSPMALIGDPLYIYIYIYEYFSKGLRGQPSGVLIIIDYLETVHP